MSQAQAPREFKFVGAFSRKRRSRKAPLAGVSPTSAKRRAVVASTVDAAHENATVPAVSATGSNSTNARDADEQQRYGDGTPLTGVTQPPQVQPSLTTPTSACQHISTEYPVENQINIVADNTSEDAIQGNDVDWSCSSFLNPFLDPAPALMASFSQNENYQLPICFGPDMPSIIPPQDTSSMDGSPPSDYVDPALPNETVESAAIDEAVLSSLVSAQAPSNISITITQLLNRCMQCVHTLSTPVTINF